MRKPGSSPAPHDPLQDLLLKAAQDAGEDADDEAVRRWLARLAEGDKSESDEQE
jgi:hypothetical protein